MVVFVGISGCGEGVGWAERKRRRTPVVRHDADGMPLLCLRRSA